MTMSDEWRDVPGYEGLYAVSNKGSVKSLAKTRILYNNGSFVTRERMLKAFPDKRGI